MKSLVKFLKNESGATAIEYGLIVALISIVCILAFQTIGTQLSTAYNNVGGNLTNANSAAG